MIRKVIQLASGLAILQMVSACNNCLTISKEQRTMVLAHSEACRPESGVTEEQLQALCRGELLDTPELRQHVYCVLHRCKIIGKDGKLLKSALVSNIKNGSKIMEVCGSQTSDNPLNAAWDLLRCLDKKLSLFHKMPADSVVMDNLA